MTTITDEVQSKAPRNEQADAAHNAALQSVYYRSLGSELESRGAPVMAVPPLALQHVSSHGSPFCIASSSLATLQATAPTTEGR